MIGLADTDAHETTGTVRSGHLPRRVWPFGGLAAIIAAPLLLLGLLAVMSLLQRRSRRSAESCLQDLFGHPLRTLLSGADVYLAVVRAGAAVVRSLVLREDDA